MSAVSGPGSKRRAAVYRRDGHVCYMCGVTCHKGQPGSRDPRDRTIDHVVPRSAGGTNDMDNLRAGCRACNDAKADAMPESYWWRLMATLARWEYSIPKAAWL